MSSPDVPETGDDVEIEVSDVRLSVGAASTPSSRSPFDLRYTRRQRLVRLSAGLLALVLAVSAITGVGGRVLALMMTPSPSPTLIPSPVSAPNFPAASSLVPAGNPFYLLPNPPGVEVSLDGHALASPPPPGDPHPLRLASGHHSLTWSSHYFPFMPMRCTISVPHASDDTCPFVNSQELPAADADLAGHVLAMRASLGALPAADDAQLTLVIQAALDANRSHATVQSGEQYYVYQQGENGSPTTVTQPLRATLSHVYLPGAGYFEPCIFTQPVIPCRFPGQDCGQICTVPQPPPDVATSPGDWIAAVIVHASWRYTTQDGRVVAQDLGEAVGLQLAVLRITWDGGGWHVTPILGATPGLPAADDLVCDPARFWLGGNGTWAFMMSDPPPGAGTQFVSDSLPTDGCLAVLHPYPRGAPSAVFLQRFGVLLAVNAAATNGGSAGLPVADAAEQQVARHLAAQVGFTIP